MNSFTTSLSLVPRVCGEPRLQVPGGRWAPLVTTVSGGQPCCRPSKSALANQSKEDNLPVWEMQQSAWPGAQLYCSCSGNDYDSDQPQRGSCSVEGSGSSGPGCFLLCPWCKHGRKCDCMYPGTFPNISSCGN